MKCFYGCVNVKKSYFSFLCAARWDVRGHVTSSPAGQIHVFRRSRLFLTSHQRETSFHDVVSINLALGSLFFVYRFKTSQLFCRKPSGEQPLWTTDSPSSRFVTFKRFDATVTKVQLKGFKQTWWWLHFDGLVRLRSSAHGATLSPRPAGGGGARAHWCIALTFSPSRPHQASCNNAHLQCTRAAPAVAPGRPLTTKFHSGALRGQSLVTSDLGTTATCRAPTFSVTPRGPLAARLSKRAAGAESFTSTGNLLPFTLCSEPADPLFWPQWNSIFSALKRPGSPAPLTK